jgi:hypothetical protein
MDERERRRRRLRRAHDLIRAELAIAYAVPLFAAFLYVAMPAGHRPMFAGEPLLIESLVTGTGAGLFLIGLMWMIRLSRPDPEAGERSWRYRDYE